MRALSHGSSMRAHVALALAALVLAGDALHPALAAAGFDYKDALTKTIIFLEAQRSGKLPPNNRVKWRGDSALDDGKLANVDLTGGYYDAGDNVKYGLPLAFTVTTLAWTALAFKPELEQTKELEHVHEAIRWGTDYLLKCAARKNKLWVQVGDPNLDHQCWVRPENMKAPRTLYEIDEKTPGTEIAAETAAAFAASSMVFRNDKKYSRALLNKAKLLFLFAKAHQGSYDGECPFYCSYSGYNDELLWAATWLYLATKRQVYADFISHEAISSSVAEFSWDLKFPGAQVLLAEFNMTSGGGAQNFKAQADNFVCAVLPDTAFHQVFITPGGVIHLRDGANTQYVTSTSFLFVVYSDLLLRTGQSVMCGNQPVAPARLREFARQQMDYLLGANPRHSSYVVGFGANSPTQPHHRGASTPVLAPGTDVNCGLSFGEWMAPDKPNPNELTGAIVGGPDKNDGFVDKRGNSSYTEPCTYINSLAIGPLAALAVRGAQLVATH
ncbi:endoglucanase 8-like [Miscanthus floridulus]|uniref:endoglucanase 8-like n=1 Tax=Miscanthus floridulus TaxID=154761 RepID=UPI0034575C7E